MKAILKPGAAVCALLLGASILAGVGVSRPQTSKTSKPLASAELDVPGVVAEVFESTRRDGVLTVRVRFRNTGATTASLTLAVQGQYDDNHIVADKIRYPVMRDSSGYVAATPMNPGGELSARIPKGGTWSWWGKFSAVPADVKTYALYLKVGPPIEDIPIVDK